MMLAGLGHKDFYRLDPASSSRSSPITHASPPRVQPARPRQGKRILKDAATRASRCAGSSHELRASLQACARGQEPARGVGFKIDLQVADWATVVQRRAKPELWDAFSTAFVFLPEPTVAAQVLCDWPGWWCHPDKEALLQAMGREFD